MRIAAFTTAGLLGGTAVAAGATLAVQAFGEEPIATVQTHKRTSNHVVAGAGAGAALIGAAFVGNLHASPRAGVAGLLAAAVGAASGAYLLAPAIRRWLAEH